MESRSSHRAATSTTRTPATSLLGEILERQTGHSLAAAYRTLLGFDRLGLQHTYLEGLEPTPAHVKPRAHQYLSTTDTADFDPPSTSTAAVASSPPSPTSSTFYRALLGGHVFENPATLRTMLGKPRSTRPTGLGMGIFAESIGRENCWHHDGFWGTTVLHCPRAGVTIAITVNQAEDFDSAIHELDAAVLRLVSRT
jgi:D-alanyl-D-alanine carboxypeptidase